MWCLHCYGEAARLDTCFCTSHSIAWSNMHEQSVSMLPLIVRAAFVLSLDMRSSYSQREFAMDPDWTQVLMIAKPAFYHWAIAIYLHESIILDLPVPAYWPSICSFLPCDLGDCRGQSNMLNTADEGDSGSEYTIYSDVSDEPEFTLTSSKGRRHRFINTRISPI